MAKRKSKRAKAEQIIEHLFVVKVKYYAGLADTVKSFLISVPQPAGEPPSFEQAIDGIRSVVAAARRDDKDAYQNDRMLSVELFGTIDN
jgi:hypothetical protein